MAEFIDYFKIVMDYLKVNKWLVLLALSGVGSVATNISQLFGYQEIEEELVQTRNQVAEVAKHYIAKKVAIKSTCRPCSLSKHLKEDH